MTIPGRLISVILMSAVLLSVGCAADVTLRNPSSGQAAVCKGGYWTWGLIGLANQTPKQLQLRCLDDYQGQGYQRVPG